MPEDAPLHLSFTERWLRLASAKQDQTLPFMQVFEGRWFMRRWAAPARLSHATWGICAVLGVAPEGRVETRDIPFLFQSHSAVPKLIGAVQSQETRSGGQCRGCCWTRNMPPC